MASTKSNSIKVLDKSSRRTFMRNTGGVLLAGASASLGGSALAADCDRVESSDQDTGEEADQKACGHRENIISKNQPKRTAPISLKTIKT